MPEFQNRTLICSVLFIDIVEYSRAPVVEQGKLKDLFNALLSEALRGVAINDRIILDTGDGAAISFIGDPEDALFVATSVRDVIEALPRDTPPQLLIRMGINLGPVRLVKDINGQPNIIGDGINVAQRVMSFSKPGQVLVSRSYYEVVSRLSDESSRLFSYEGARTDKHVREHEVYAVGSFPGARRVFEEMAPKESQTNGAAPSPAALTRVSETVKNAAGRIARRPRLATALAVVAILGIALGARSYRTVEDLPRAAPTQAAAPAPAVAPPPEPEKPLPPIRGLPPEPEPQQAIAVVPPPPAEKKPAKDLKAREKPREAIVAQAPRPAPPPPEEPAATGAPAIVSFALSPWGEVYVDGRMLGVSPPLQDLELAPGRHRIELRNAASQSHVITVTAKPGERIRIRHKFN